MTDPGTAQKADVVRLHHAPRVVTVDVPGDDLDDEERIIAGRCDPEGPARIRRPRHLAHGGGVGRRRRLCPLSEQARLLERCSAPTRIVPTAVRPRWRAQRGCPRRRGRARSRFDASFKRYETVALHRNPSPLEIVSLGLLRPSSRATTARRNLRGERWPQPCGFGLGRGLKMRLAGIEPATLRSGGARSIP